MCCRCVAEVAGNTNSHFGAFPCFNRYRARRPARRMGKRRAPIRRRRVIRRRRSRSGAGPKFHVRLMRRDHALLKAGQSIGVAFVTKIKDFVDGITWDYYKINKIVIKFQPRSDSRCPAGHETNGVCASSIDYDTPVAPKAFEELANLQNTRFFKTLSTHTRIFRPKAHTNLMGASANAGLVSSPWIDSGYPEVEHYGLRAWLTNNGGGDVSWDIIIKLYCTFKQPLFTAKKPVDSARLTAPLNNLARGEERPMTGDDQAPRSFAVSTAPPSRNPMYVESGTQTD